MIKAKKKEELKQNRHYGAIRRSGLYVNMRELAEQKDLNR